MSKSLLDEVFSLDKGVRYVAVLSPRGMHLEGGMRPGTRTLNPPGEESKLFLQANVTRGMSESWSKFFGEFKFSFFSHSKLNVSQFPLGENVLLVTTEPDVPMKLTQDIARIVQKFKSKGAEGIPP